MRSSRSSSLLAALATMAACVLPLAGAQAKDEALAKAIHSKQRTPELVARDSVRKPQEVLEFIGIKPNMTVVEVVPGGGYWTEILAPYLNEKGTYYTAVGARGLDGWKSKLAADPARFGKVKVTDFDKLEPGPAGSADAVVTFRNIHNWMARGTAEQVFASFYKTLKPGGILGVEEHRAPTDKPQDPKAANGYVREDYAIALAEKAGFKLVSRSELLANPNDPRTSDVFNKSIRGKTDQFVLKFRKPAA